MIEIHKHSLEGISRFIEIPTHEEAELLSCQESNNILNIWFKVDKTYPPKIRKFIIYYTGEIIKRNHIKYVTTIIAQSGLILHIFEIKENK